MGGVSFTTAEEKRQMKSEQGLTCQVPGASLHRLFVSPSPVVDVPHCRDSQINLHAVRALWDIKQSPTSDLVLGTFPRALGVGGLNPKACQLPDLILFFY